MSIKQMFMKNDIGGCVSSKNVRALKEFKPFPSEIENTSSPAIAQANKLQNKREQIPSLIQQPFYPWKESQMGRVYEYRETTGN